MAKSKWIFLKKEYNAYNYSDIVDFELLEDAELISYGG